MGLLLLGTIGLIAFGTLYPFGFDCPASVNLAVQSFRPLWHPIGRGDLAANLVLFAPLGLAACAWAGRLPPAVRYPFALGLGALLSFGVELAQTCTNRTPSWSDVGLNVISTGIGVLLLPMFRRVLQRRQLHLGHADIAAALLLGMFVVWQLAPFVPTIDWQKWRNAVKPLLLRPDITLPMVLGYAVIWLVMARLSLAVFSPARPLLLWIALAAGHFALELVIIGKTIRLGEVAGAAIGIALAPFLASRPSRSRDLILILLLAAYVIDQGLQPYAVAPGSAPFHWLPFAGFLHGSMFVSVQSIGQKLFCYGGLVWLAVRAGIGLGKAAVIVSLAVLGLEIAQTRLPGRVAEITDPLLVLLAAAVIRQLDRGGLPAPNRGAKAPSRRPRPPAGAARRPARS